MSRRKKDPFQDWTQELAYKKNEEDHKGPQRWLAVIYSTTECPSPDKGHKRYPYTKLVYSLMLLPSLWRRWAWTIRKLWKQEVCFQDRKKYPQFVSWFVSTALIAECITIYYEKKNKVKLHFHYNYFPAAARRCFPTALWPIDHAPPWALCNPRNSAS